MSVGCGLQYTEGNAAALEALPDLDIRDQGLNSGRHAVGFRILSFVEASRTCPPDWDCSFGPDLQQLLLAEPFHIEEIDAGTDGGRTYSERAGR